MREARITLTVRLAAARIAEGGSIKSLTARAACSGVCGGCAAEGVAQPDRGELVPDEEMDAFFDGKIV